MSIINLPVQPGNTDFNNAEQVEKLRDTLDQLVKREIPADQYFAINEVSMLLTEIVLSLKRKAAGHSIEFHVEDDFAYHPDGDAGVRIIAPSAEEAAHQYAVDNPDANSVRVYAHGRTRRFRCIRNTVCTVSLVCENHGEFCDCDGYCEECGHQ